MRLHVAEYPGRGIHHVLVDIAARDQRARARESVHFAATYRARNGEDASVAAYPVFLGFPVGPDGIAIELITVKVASEADERLLAAFESDAFKAGLSLAGAWQPALVPLSELVVGITRALASRTRNAAIQRASVGLDFGDLAGGVRLAEGTYVVAQTPSEFVAWDWSRWAFDPRTSRLIDGSAPGEPVPFNYVLLGVQRHDGG